MNAPAIRYIQPVFRPPARRSPSSCRLRMDVLELMHILRDIHRATKTFRPRDEEEVFQSIRRCGQDYGDTIKRVFLADGDAMTLSFRRLSRILEAIRQYMPSVRRVSSYCLPRNVSKKSVAELTELADLGLSFVYVGAESGDDEVLARVKKGETFQSTLEALDKLHEAGIKRSVMILMDWAVRNYRNNTL